MPMQQKDEIFLQEQAMAEELNPFLVRKTNYPHERGAGCVCQVEDTPTRLERGSSAMWERLPLETKKLIDSVGGVLARAECRVMQKGGEFWRKNLTTNEL